MKKEGSYYIVHKKILPEVVKKTVEVNELLNKEEHLTINEAVKRVGISRSAYYKYKDYITPFYKMNNEKIITLALILEHHPGVLSTVLNAVSNCKGNILTINQGIPLQGLANVSISIEIGEINIDLEELIEHLRQLEGVRKVELIAQN